MSQNYLVIGGSGLVGSAIVKMLLERGHKVSLFDIREPKTPIKNVTCFVGDLCNTKDLEKAFKGVDVVVHTASPPHGLGSEIYFKVNVDGTKNVIAACHVQKVKKLIFTSSASVVFNGEDIVGGDETLPYCEKHMDSYNESKCIAEQLVLEANSKKLVTVALRPSGIFGPGDMQGTWEMYQYSKKASRYIALGDNTALFDFTFVDNVAWSHVLAGETATFENGIGGQVFNITNDQPVFMWDFMHSLFEELGARPSFLYSIPFSVAFPLAYLAESLVWILSPIKKIHLTFSVFRLKFLSSNRYFDIEKAKNVLKYRPIVSLEDGIKETVKWLKTQK